MPEQLTDAGFLEQVAVALGYDARPSSRYPGRFMIRKADTDEPRELDPNWPVSLDACREIIAEVERRGSWKQFAQEFGCLLETDNVSLQAWELGVYDALLATPRQICEAFINALGAL